MDNEGSIVSGFNGIVSAPIEPVFSDALDGDGMIIRSHTRLGNGAGVGIGVSKVGGAYDDPEINR